MNFKDVLAEKTELIEQMVCSFLPTVEGYPKTVLDAMAYSVRVGGKRLRPMLMLETHKFFGGKSNAVSSFAAALEMIHTYSLVHDDLPAMDNDDLRRGKPTTWSVYGETMGILAGDALLNYAFEVAARAVEEEPSAQTARALSYLAKKAGIFGMIGGQVVDIESEGTKPTLDTILYIHENKTAALIQAAMVVGAILAGADDEDVKKIESVAYDVGVAFQIKDDILDVTSTAEELGKPIGSDARNEKTTYVSLKGLEDAQKDVEQISRRALATLASCNGENEFLEALIEMLVERGK